jgi:site-specific DNA recombinase
MLMTLLTRVDVGSSRIDLRVSRVGLADLLAGRKPDLTKPRGKQPNSPRDTIVLAVPARLKRVGREMRMLVENPDDRTPANRGLLRIIARAHDIQLRLMQNVDLTVHEVASEEHVSAAYIYSVLRLSSLAPDIVGAIVNGRNPPQLTAKKLMRLSPHLPIDWTEQRKLLGFS